MQWISQYCFKWYYFQTDQKESDVRRISYGGMLVEGVLAVFAMGCVAVLTVSEREAGGTPVGIFASGAAKFLVQLVFPPH